jgi:hypothetical protein
MKYERIQSNPSNKTYSNLCHLLQRKESYIFGKVWEALLKEKIKFIPIHDSIIVRKDDAAKAELVMTSVLRKHLNNPKINKK